MTPKAAKEVAFEIAAEKALLSQGWSRPEGAFDAELGFYLEPMFRFVTTTQPKQWKRLVIFEGGDEVQARNLLSRRVATDVNERGVLDVLRQGVKERGLQFDLAYFRPGHTLAIDALVGYEANVLTVARQVYFSKRFPDKSVDMALFVNGLPTATVELKNPNTGQNADHAMAQYRERDPNELLFAKRALVHFAVDPDRAFLTTALRGADTRFLPFNVGTNGPGISGSAGNPPTEGDRYAVSYLWEQIWQRDNWLEILQRFIHLVLPDKKGLKADPHTLPRIFPRFHQWHAVHRMVAHAREHGVGHSYLIQHSAGSGKSNTLAWLSHRLSNLFDAGNQQVFHKVIVITDRLVLDRQLQKTIYQFDHTPGVVRKIDTDSKELARALMDSTAKIVISTSQLYGYALDKIDQELAHRRYAVVIDEAHSSQGGEFSANIKKVVGANAMREEGEDEATYQTRVRGKQPNLSYFAFTATPKSSTLKLFGMFDPTRRNPHTGKLGMQVPFHVYSMRQAIDEGYILDVLANYLTYKSRWRLRNAAADHRKSQLTNPDVAARRARRELIRYAELHPKAISQKAVLIVDDFRENMAWRLEGRAKAMVVTSGREHAHDLYQAMKTYIARAGFTDCGTLVAFSGSLKDKETDIDFSESMLNGFSETQLPEMFRYVKADDPYAATRRQDEYRLLVVADKYQTGFDEPLLCGMYVDKALTGIAAVQTLSRLNRIHNLKTQEDVRILDLFNKVEAIKESFKDWYEATISDPPAWDVLYQKQRLVMSYQILVASEMDSYMKILQEAATSKLTSTAESRLHAQLHNLITPALDRFAALDTDDEREGFRGELSGYLSAYSLIAQVVDWGDPDLERLYEYGRTLLKRLPGRPTVAVDIGDPDLTHYRLSETGRHNLALTPTGDRDVRGHAADGGYHEPDMRPLAEVIDELNERFGLDLGTSDQILFYQQVAGIVENPTMEEIALMNGEERFAQVIDGALDGVVAENAERNLRFAKVYFDNDEFRKVYKEEATKQAYRIFTSPVRDQALNRLREAMRRDTLEGTPKG
ncbi:type I restriction endonuclease subunit R [Nocardia sp. CA-128927]|uniref:type I restriction endonuclease subunit R n=1 Tax=Nocardia sp. CA-128927 TaxID=3239975 RepID=UPI003D98601E